MKYNFNYTYDHLDPKSIEAYAQSLIGKTFNEICLENTMVEEAIDEDGFYASDGSCRRTGNIIERDIFANRDTYALRRSCTGNCIKTSPYKHTARF